MLSAVFEYGASLADAVLVVWFVTRFLKNGFSPKLNPYWIPAIITIYVYTLFSDRFMPDHNVLSTFIFLALYITYALLVSKRQWVRAIIAGCFFEAVLVLLSTLLFFILSISFNNFDLTLQGAGNYVRYLALTLHKILIFAACKLMLVIFADNKESETKDGIIPLVFTVITVVGVSAALAAAIASSDKIVQVASLVVTGVLIASNILLYVLISRILKLQKIKYDMKLTESKMQYEHEMYEKAKVLLDDSRRIRHDFKQHLGIISKYVSEGEREKCGEYVNALYESVEHPPYRVIRSDDPVIDYVLNTKLGGRDDIELLVSGSLGDISDISEPDMVSILGNVIDNAIEGVNGTKRKLIEVLFYIHESNRCIICKNSVKASVLASNAKLETTKPDKNGHGLGITIIKQTSAKYGGMIDCYEENDTNGDVLFCIQVLIPKNR